MRSLTITKPVNCTVKVSYLLVRLISEDVLFEEEHTSSIAEDVVLKVKVGVISVIITVYLIPYAFEHLSIGGTKQPYNPALLTR